MWYSLVKLQPYTDLYWSSLPILSRCACRPTNRLPDCQGVVTRNFRAERSRYGIRFLEFLVMVRGRILLLWAGSARRDRLKRKEDGFT